MNDQTQPSVLSALWRYRLMSAVIIIDLTLLAAAAGLLIAPPARATAVIALNNPQPASVLAPGIQGDASLARYTAQRARFVTSDAVMGAVADRLDQENITSLRRQVTVTPSTSSNTMTISVEATTPTEASEIATAIVEAYGTETEAQVRQLTDAAIQAIGESSNEAASLIGPDELPELVTSVGNTLNQLRLEASELEQSRALFGNGIEFVIAPRVEAAETAGAPLRETALGFILGIVVAATVAWIRADRERGVTSALEPEGILDAPLLGEVHAPSDLGRPEALDLGGLPSHDYRLVWSALLRRAPAGALLVNSANEEPRAMAALNLAIAAAREDLSVLLVDGDLHRGVLSTALDLSTDTEGVRALFADGGDYKSRVVSVDLGGIRQLAVIPAGGSGEELNVSTQVVEHYLRAWKQDYDLVIIDAPPMGSSQLASVLSGAVDRALVVVRKGTDAADLEELRRWVSLQGTPVVGYVYASTTERSWRPADLLGSR